MQALAKVQRSLHCSVLRVLTPCDAHMWPVGQAVKTAASHAANVGSIPARVTIFFLLREEEKKENFDKVSLDSEKKIE